MPVYLYDDKLMIALNYREGVETIFFDDTKEVDSGSGFSYNTSESRGSDLDSLLSPKCTKNTVFS
jgi:hypothetical protein